VEMEEGAEESILPQVAAAGSTGVDRNPQAVAAATMVAGEGSGREVRARRGLDWVGLTDPVPNRLG
jgi:hypothetical protein